MVGCAIRTATRRTVRLEYTHMCLCMHVYLCNVHSLHVYIHIHRELYVYLSLVLIPSLPLPPLPLSPPPLPSPLPSPLQVMMRPSCPWIIRGRARLWTTICIVFWSSPWHVESGSLLSSTHATLDRCWIYLIATR